MSEKGSCCGPVRYSLVFACSGASDVGEITDLAARRLSRDRWAFMCCTAAIAGNIEEVVPKARCAAKVVVLDGCSSDCAKLVLDRAGFKRFRHVCLEDLGIVKARSPVTEERVSQVAQRARDSLLT